MKKTTAQHQLITLTVVLDDGDKRYDLSGKDGRTEIRAFPASCITKVQPLTPLWAKNARSFVVTTLADQDGSFFVVETVAEVIERVNAQRDTENWLSERAVHALETIASELGRWAETNYGRGI